MFNAFQDTPGYLARNGRFRELHESARTFNERWTETSSDFTQRWKQIFSGVDSLEWSGDRSFLSSIPEFRSNFTSAGIGEGFVPKLLIKDIPRNSSTLPASLFRPDDHVARRKERSGEKAKVGEAKSPGSEGTEPHSSGVESSSPEESEDEEAESRASRRAHYLTKPNFDLSESEWVEKVLLRASVEFASGGMLRQVKYAAVLRLCGNDGFCAFQDCYWAKFLHMLVKFHGYTLPYEENMNGEIRYVSKCNLALPRIISMCLTLIWDEMNGRHIGIELAIREMALYIMLDPYSNWKDVKTWTRPFVMSMFVNSTAGHGFVFTAKEGVTLVEQVELCQEEGIDSEIDKLYETEQMDAAFSLAEHKMGNTMDAYTILRDAEVTMANLRMGSHLQAPFQIVSYVKGDEYYSAEEQFTGSRPKHIYGECQGGDDFTPGCGHPGCYPCAVRRVASEMMDSAFDNKLINPETAFEDFLWIIITGLTGRSGGVAPEKVNSFYRGQYVSAMVSSKVALFNIDPHAWLTRVLAKAEPPSAMTLGQRFDIGRNPRKITMLTLLFYLKELASIDGLKNAQALHPHLTIRKQDERHFANHAWIRYLNNDRKNLSFSRDASQMDYSSAYYNNRRLDMLGRFDSIRGHFASDSYFGDWAPGLLEYSVKDGRGTDVHRSMEICGYERFVRDTYDVYPKMRYVTKESKLEFSVDQVASGEAGTINIHNITNVAYGDVWLVRIRHALAERYPYIQIEYAYRSYTGDDALEVFTVNGTFDQGIVDIIVAEMKALNEISGFEMNPSKMKISFAGNEYLKKSFFMGTYMPRSGRIQFMVDERSQSQKPRFEILASMQAKVGEYLTRGGSEALCHTFLAALFVASAAFSWRGTGDRYDEREQYVVSPVFAYTPRRFKGLGWGMSSLVIDAKDEYTTRQIVALPPDEREFFLRTALIYEKVRWRLKDRIDPLEVLPALQKGVDFATAHLDSQRLHHMHRALELLDGRSRFPSKLRYDKTGERMVDQALENLEMIRKLRQMTRRDTGRAFLAASRRTYDPARLLASMEHFLASSWYDLVDLEAVECDPVTTSPPVATFDSVGTPTLTALICNLGPAVNADRGYDPLKSLNKIRDSKFPRDITIETIADILFSPDLAGKPDLQRLTLIGMGGTPTRAEMIVQGLVNTDVNPMVIKSLMGWSNSDPILSLLDVSSHRLIQRIDVSSMGLTANERQSCLASLGLYLLLDFSGLKMKVSFKDPSSAKTKAFRAQFLPTNLKV